MADEDGSTKRCGRCKLDLDAGLFGADPRTSTGLRCYCRPCEANKMAAARALKPKKPRKTRKLKPLVIVDSKICPQCKLDLPLFEFGPCKQKRSGLKSWCKKCHSADGCKRWAEKDAQEREATYSNDRAWRAANREKNAAYTQNWRIANPDAAKAVGHARRARLRNAEGRYTDEDVAAILKAQKGKCAYCKVGIKNSYHVDHISPLARGGSNWPKNIQLTCHSCNSRKHAKNPIEFAQSIGRLL